jgi:hypothetical protein
LNQKSKTIIHLGEYPIVFDIELADDKHLKRELNNIKTLLINNNEQIIAVCTEMFRSKERIEHTLHGKKSIRLPEWMSKVKIDVVDLIALVLYFGDRSFTVKKITEILNTFRKIDLRNVSKQLTSKNSNLFGYTFYDDNTRTYGLNIHGKNWVERDLMNKVKRSSQTKDNSKKTGQARQLTIGKYGYL